MTAFPMGRGEVRYVVHRLIDDGDVEFAIDVTARVARGEAGDAAPAATPAGYAN